MKGSFLSDNLSEEEILHRVSMSERERQMSSELGAIFHRLLFCCGGGGGGGILISLL